MSIKNVTSDIKTYHKYVLKSQQAFSRLGRLIKRYGEYNVTQSIKDIKTETNDLNHLFNLMEIKCQQLITQKDDFNILEVKI